MTSLTRWTWVWVSSERWWRIGTPGVLQSIGLQRVKHNWVTEQHLLDKSVVWEKTLESPLDRKEIQPVHYKGDQPWVFTGRTDVEDETLILLPPHEKSWLIGKDPNCWDVLGAGEEGDDREWDGWKASPTQGTWVWIDSGVGDGQGGLACCDSRGRKKSDTTEQLNWTPLILVSLPYSLTLRVVLYFC